MSVVQLSGSSTRIPAMTMELTVGALMATIEKRMGVKQRKQELKLMQGGVASELKRKEQTFGEALGGRAPSDGLVEGLVRPLRKATAAATG